MALRLGILTTIWKRPELTELVLRYYAGLRSKDVSFKLIAVASSYEEEMDAIHNGWAVKRFPNEPLGAKWNAGLAEFRHPEFACDAVLIVGSDDLVSAGYIDRVVAQLRGGAEYITVRDLYIFDVLQQRLVYAHSAMAGAGRVISTGVLDRLDWKLWEEEANYLLDGSIQASLRNIPMRNHHVRSMLEEDFAVVDIKTGENMWKLEGDRLVGAGGREMHFRKVTELAPEPFFQRYFPGQAEQLLNWQYLHEG